MIDKLFTLTGLPVDQIFSRLAQSFGKTPLPGSTPGCKSLPDTFSQLMHERISQVFGLRGLGWNLLFSRDDIEVTCDPAAPDRTIVHLKHAVFQYTLIDSQGERLVCEIPTFGSSQEAFQHAEEAAWSHALEAALNCIGLRFTGEHPSLIDPLPHQGDPEDVNDIGVKSSTFPEAAPANSPASNPLPELHENSQERAEKLAADTSAAAPPGNLDDPGDFEIPIGRYGPQNGQPGKKLRGAPLAWVQWAANQMQPTSEKTRALQAAARAFLNCQTA